MWDVELITLSSCVLELNVHVVAASSHLLLYHLCKIQGPPQATSMHLTTEAALAGELSKLQLYGGKNDGEAPSADLLFPPNTRSPDIMCVTKTSSEYKKVQRGVKALC